MSLLTACMETLPHFHHEDMGNEIIRDDLWCVIEISTNVWFLFEILTRFIFAETKLKFCTGSMNLIDFFAVVPYFSLVLLNNEKTGKLKKLKKPNYTYFFYKKVCKRVGAKTFLIFWTFWG